jgi:hypothetical protein
LKPHLKKQWVISKFDAEFLARMEHVLHLYHLPYNPAEPVICFDERPCQLIQDVLSPLPMKPGRVKRQDYNYKRNGTCSLLVAFEPLKGLRIVEVVEKRTKVEYARFMQRLLGHYDDAKCIHIIQDNLSTHTKGAFYEAFPAGVAFEMGNKTQFHFTPVKASWLNMVEIELSVLARMCLNRRIPSIEILTSEVKQLVKERNEIRATVNWQFTVQNARSKLRKHYFNDI